jgi:hypothetical protein
MLTRKEFEQLKLALLCSTNYCINGQEWIHRGNALLIVETYAEEEPKSASLEGKEGK